jgi:uracil-DNA glycosylase family 4
MNDYFLKEIYKSYLLSSVYTDILLHNDCSIISTGVSVISEIDKKYEPSKAVSGISAIDSTNKKNKKECIDLDFFVRKLDNIKSLDELYKEIHCHNLCLLRNSSTNTVVCDGKKDAEILLIGEAPGEQEDIEMKPFCGKSGKLLRKALNSIDVSVEKNLYITNTVFWRPPLNRAPTQEEINSCLPFVLKQILLINPKIILLCGRTAIDSILRKNDLSMSELRDGNFSISLDGKLFPIYNLYHPSFLLRSPYHKKDMWGDLKKIKNAINNFK